MGVFEYWAGLRKEGQTFNFNQAEKVLYDKLKEATSIAQKKAFPILRDAFGPILREMLWEDDITAKTFGNGYQTVEFVGGCFAANRNIKQFYAGARTALYKLRFKQARFKWFKEASEYTFFTLSCPKDDELVVWGSDDQPQVIL